MKKEFLSYRGIGTLFALFGIISGFICLCIALIAQFNVTEVAHNESSGYLGIVLFIFLILSTIMYIIEKVFPYEFNRTVLIHTLIPFTALLGSIYSLLFIYYSVGNSEIHGLPLNNQLSFLSLFFFAIYTLMYNGFITDWWENIENFHFKGLMLILIEIPNFISWWVLAYATPLNYIKDISSPVHFWLTFTFALSLVSLITSIRLIKIKKHP